MEDRVFEWKTRKKLLNDEIAEFIKKGVTVDNIYRFEIIFDQLL